MGWMVVLEALILAMDLDLALSVRPLEVAVPKPNP